MGKQSMEKQTTVRINIIHVAIGIIMVAQITLKKSNTRYTCKGENMSKERNENGSQVDALLGRLVAINKKTGIKRTVGMINIDQKQVYLHGDRWGVWHNYSKRGDCILSA